MGKTDSDREHHSPYSSQSPDYCGNSKTGNFGNLERCHLDIDIYNGVLTMGTVNNVFGFPWILLVKDNG